MNTPDLEQQRRLVRQWVETGRELERLRREALRGMPYNWQEVDALLSLADHLPRVERMGGVLVEVQRYFKKYWDRR